MRHTDTYSSRMNKGQDEYGCGSCSMLKCVPACMWQLPDHHHAIKASHCCAALSPPTHTYVHMSTTLSLSHSHSLSLSFYKHTHLEGGDGGGSNPEMFSRFSGTYSCTSITLFTLPFSSRIARWLGSCFQSPSTMNLYCRTVGRHIRGAQGELMLMLLLLEAPQASEAVL